MKEYVYVLIGILIGIFVSFKGNKVSEYIYHAQLRNCRAELVEVQNFAEDAIENCKFNN